ncbi:MAG: GNAT family N-acetyltransferase [Saprospiraceae bacterium]|nr:GNAT family N-acetyltransferase [Saprospiraceae bacterium]
MTIIIKQITDLTHLKEVAIVFDLYRQFYKQPCNILLAERFLRERILGRESVIFAAFERDVAIGFTQLYPSFSSVSAQRSWILNDLFIRESYRKRGIAELLMNHTKSFAIQTYAKGLALETAEDNPAQHLYERLGWEKETGVLHYFWKNSEA